MYKSVYDGVCPQRSAWRKTNFHTHAGVCREGHCGILPLDDVVAAYKRANCDVLAISNHDMYLPREREYEGICLLDAVEYSTHPHILLIGVNEFHDVSHQAAIDIAVEAGGFVILCHPNWMHKGYLPWDFLDSLTGYTGIEIVNSVIQTLEGSALALDTWDHVLSQGKQVWGFGNDDFHHFCDTDRVFNMIYAPSGRYEDIRDAVLNGRFYVSTGVALQECVLDGHTLRVTAGSFTDTYVTTYEYKFTGANGRLLLKIEGDSACFEIPEGEPYVRVEVTADTGAKLYLQPFFKV